MKRFIYVIFLALGLMTMVPQSANAQFSGFLKNAVAKGTQAAKNKKAAKEYNALCDVVNQAIENHDLRYFCAANRREELRRAAAAAEIDNSEMDDKISKFFSEETDLNNPDHIASARGLLARSKAEKDIPTSNYLLKCAKIQYNTELQKANLESFPALQALYDEITAYEDTFTNGRNKGDQITSPERFQALLELEKERNTIPEYEAADMSKVVPSTRESKPEEEVNQTLPGENPKLFTNWEDWKTSDRKTVIATVKSDGTVLRGNREICRVKENGEIYVSNRLWGQVMLDNYRYNIYQYDRNNKPVIKGYVEKTANGTVYWEYQKMGYVEYGIKDSNGNIITDAPLGNTSLVHRAVGFFLYDKIR